MKRTQEFKRITYICQLCFSIFKVPIIFLDPQGELIRHDFYYPRNPLGDNQIPQSLFPDTSLSRIPRFAYTEYYENYFAINVILSNRYYGKIIVGPATSSKINQLTIDSFFSNFKNSPRLKGDVNKYYAHLTVIDSKLWADFACLLYFLLYQEKVDLPTLTAVNYPSKIVAIKKNLESYLDEKKQNSQFHHTEHFTKGLLQAIKEGNRNKLQEQLSKPLDGTPGTHAKNLLRNSKNLFISTVSLASHAAVEGGLEWELALSLSDIYIQKAEELQEIKDIHALCYTMMCDYTDRVHALRVGNYSKPVIYALHYISKHLYTKLTLPEIAESLHMSPNYLSQLFKKEVGIPISRHIQIEKITEAKKLLLNHAHSILNICVLLGFTDQSYFTKVFKEHTGVTPTEFRQQSTRNKC